MRGHIRRASKDRAGLAPGEHSYDLVLSIGRALDGKWKQRWSRFHGTREQAEAKLADLVSKHHRGDLAEPSKIKVGEWADEWLDKSIKPPLRTLGTYRTYENVVRNHLKPALGTYPLQRLSKRHVERYYADCKLSHRTLGLVHAVLVSMLSAAMEEGFLNANVANKAKNRPRGNRLFRSKAVHNVWATEEARRFLHALKQSGNAQETALFALALDCGVRKNELSALRWCDLDGSALSIKQQLIRVNKTEETPDGWIFAPPKNGSERQIALSQDTLDLLKTHKREQSELKLKNRLHYLDHGLMFAQSWDHQNSSNTRLGDPLNAMTINHRLDRLCKAAQVKRITVHGLRHTCATLLLAAGVPPNVVQQRLGHRNIAITLGVYAHVLPSQQVDAATRLAALLHG